MSKSTIKGSQVNTVKYLNGEPVIVLSQPRYDEVRGWVAHVQYMHRMGFTWEE